MTTISTLDELRELPARSSVYVKNDVETVWEKLPTGAFECGGAVVDVPFFETDVRRGRVSVAKPPTVGRFYAHEGDYIYVCAVGTGCYVTATFSESGAFRGLQVVDWAQGEEQEDSPEWFTGNMREMVNAGAVSLLNSTRVGGEARAMRSQIVALREEVEALRGAAGVNHKAWVASAQEKWEAFCEDQEIEEDDDVAEFMMGLGFRMPTPPNETINLSIDISGTTVARLDHYEASGHVGGGVDISDVDQFTIYWTVSAYHSVEVESGSCGCDGVDTTWVSQYLDGVGINYADFDYEVTCDND